MMDKELELKFQEILDWVYQTNSDTDNIRIEIGIWQTEDTPYTVYALLKSGDQVMCGESSYDSETVTEAIDLLLDELYK